MDGNAYGEIIEWKKVIESAVEVLGAGEISIFLPISQRKSYR
jgi:hypothetical protein